MEHAQGTTATLEAGHRGAGGVHGEEGERGEAHARRAQAEDDQAEDAQEVAARRGVGVACNFCRRSHTLCETYAAPLPPPRPPHPPPCVN
jgi:hypothetical protein